MNTNDVSDSNGVNRSYGVNGSNGVNLSDGVNRSYGVSYSDGVNLSDGVNWSYGVNLSDGVNGSNGVSYSDGVNRSYGIINSYGVDNAIFLADKPRTFSIFGREVTEERYAEVWQQLHSKLGSWCPNWQQPDDTWKDMPKEAIEYVISLPEFDAVMFKRITGIDTKSSCDHSKDYNYCPHCGKKI